MATVELRYDPKDTAWFTTNAAMILKAGEPAYHETTGQFKLGDGVTAISALSFLPAATATPTLQQVLAAGNITGALDIELSNNQNIISNDTQSTIGFLAGTKVNLNTYDVGGNYSDVTLNKTSLVLSNSDGINTNTLTLTPTAGVTNKNFEATSFIKTGGTSSQFLKADGSIDSTAYGVGNALTSNPLSQFAATTSLQLKNIISDETGSGALVFGTSPTFTTSITTPNIIGTGTNLTITAKTTLTDEMYLGASAIYGIWSWNAGSVILRSGSNAVNFTIGTPAYMTNLVSFNATGNVAIGGLADNALDQLQVSNTIGTPTLNLRGRSGSAPTIINFVPFDATNSVINFRTTAGTVRGFIDLNIASGEMKFWGSSGGYFPTFGSNGSERMRIDTNGNVIINTAAIATTATNGFLYIPSCAGAPTGVPTTVTGRTPMVYDSTNNRFYIYSGSWRSVVLA